MKALQNLRVLVIEGNKCGQVAQCTAGWVVAHSCTIFPGYLGMEIQHRVVTPYMGVQITNGALGAQTDQIERGFWQTKIVQLGN